MALRIPTLSLIGMIWLQVRSSSAISLHNLLAQGEKPLEAYQTLSDLMSLTESSPSVGRGGSTEVLDPLRSFALLSFSMNSPSAFKPVAPAGHATMRKHGQRRTSSTKFNAVTESSMVRPVPHIDRRSLLSFANALAALSILPNAAVAKLTAVEKNAAALEKAAAVKKVVVFGGSGYVGSYVMQKLLEKGCDVVSVSRKSPSDQAQKVNAILGKDLPGVEYKQLDVLTGDMSEILNGTDAVISCVGIAPGGANQNDGNGLANVKIVYAAKQANVKNFAYIGVASELSSSPAKFVLGDYFKGKSVAETAVEKNFPGNSLIVKPGIIEGAPPGEIRPPGPPGMKPVPPTAVANAVIAGALGLKIGPVDGNPILTSWIF